jgi:hypothetical protein
MQLICAWYPLDMYEGHGVKYHPNVTQNGYTERGNPQWLSVTSRRPGRMLLRRRMPQEANALGNAGDTLTWGRYTRRHRSRMESVLWQAHKRTEDRMQVHTLSAQVSSSVGEQLPTKECL